MVLSKSAMTELRKHLNFTQIRFHCKKRGGRTFHITTAANSTGETAVKYLSGETDVIPASYSSFLIMCNDNSRLSRTCKDWGYEKGPKKIGKWGHAREIRTDYMTTVPLYGQLTTGFLNRLAGGNATIIMWECHVAIIGKSLCDRKPP